MARRVITDVYWEKLKLIFTDKGRPGKNNREFMEAVLWAIRTGAPWRDLPPEFGSWKTVYNRYRNLVRKGVLDAFLEAQKKTGNARIILPETKQKR